MACRRRGNPAASTALSSPTASRCRASSSSITWTNRAITPRSVRWATGSPSESVPAVTGIDTRTLTRRLREFGTMRGWLAPEAMSQAEVQQERRPARHAPRHLPRGGARRAGALRSRPARGAGRRRGGQGQHRAFAARARGERHARALALRPGAARRTRGRHPDRQRARRSEGSRAADRADPCVARPPSPADLRRMPRQPDPVPRRGRRHVQAARTATEA